MYIIAMALSILHGIYADLHSKHLAWRKFSLNNTERKSVNIGLFQSSTSRKRKKRSLAPLTHMEWSFLELLSSIIEPLKDHFIVIDLMLTPKKTYYVNMWSLVHIPVRHYNKFYRHRVQMTTGSNVFFCLPTHSRTIIMSFLYDCWDRSPLIRCSNITTVA